MSKDEWASEALLAESLPLHLCLLPSVETQERIARHASLWGQLPRETQTCPWRLHLTVLAGLGGDPGQRTAPRDVLETRLQRKLERWKFAPVQIDLAHAEIWSGHLAVLVAHERAALRQIRDAALMMALEAGLRPIQAMETPHVTLSRSATPATRPPQDFEPVRWTASDVALVRSTPYPAWYEVVGRYGR